LAEIQFIHTLDLTESLISEDTKTKIDRGIYATLNFSLLFKIGNRNKWIHTLYLKAKKNNFETASGPIVFDHTLFLQEHRVGFWYDTNNWN